MPYSDPVVEGFINAATVSRMNQAVTDALNKQRGFQAQGTDIFNQSLAAQSPQAAQADLTAGADRARQGYARVQSTPLTVSPQTADEKDSSVQSNIKGYQDLTNKTSAANTAYGNLATNQAITNMLAKANLGLLGQRAGAWAAITPYQISDAQKKSTALSDTYGAIMGVLNSYGGAAPGIQSALNNQGGS